MAGLYLLTVLALTGLLYSVYGQQQRSLLTVGQPSPFSYTSPIGVRVTDELATERERQAARLQIEPVFTADPEIQRLIESSVAAAGLPAEATDVILAAYRNPEGVRAEEIPALVARAVLQSPADRRREARLVLERILLPTSTANVQLTEAAREAAALAVTPVLRSLPAGQVIVEEGDPLTEEHLRVLEAVGHYDPAAIAFAQTTWIVIGSLLLAAMLGLALFYASRHLFRQQLATARLPGGVVAGHPGGAAARLPGGPGVHPGGAGAGGDGGVDLRGHGAAVGGMAGDLHHADDAVGPHRDPAGPPSSAASRRSC